jgi:predicted nuclease of predicted toxin-antitoxin system
VVLYCDEGVDHEVVARFRTAGFETHYVAELSPRLPDELVLQEANALGALLITMDKDFGELVFRMGQISTGVLLVRLHELTPSERAEVVCAAVLAHQDELPGAFSVLSASKLRIRPRMM